MAIGTIGLFVSAMIDPIWFASRMQGIALVPEPLWWLLGAIVSFYFGEGEGFETFGVLMPIRTPADYVKPAPAWISDRHAAPVEKVAPVDAGEVGLAAVAKALEAAQ